MKKAGMDLIPEQTYQTLNQIFSSLSRQQAILLDQIKDEILLNLPQYARMGDFRQPVEKIEVIFLKKAAHLSQDEQTTLRHALVAKLALNLPKIIDKLNLPSSILELYPDAFERLADFLKRPSVDAYNVTSDYFRKDIRFVLGLSIPCGALVVDMTSRVALRSLILSVFRSNKANVIIRYAIAGGNGYWFRGHVDSRYLTEFNEIGNDNFYLYVAELMERKKEIRGYVGTSWYFDPQLLKISPRLAYLQERPRTGGAFFLRHGTQQSDIAMAIKTSETRRRLYQEGKYIPVCYSMLWPRKELLAWADQMQQSISSTDL
ncbi:MAG: hypothetical protein WA096_01530 [Smithella sp.]